MRLIKKKFDINYFVKKFINDGLYIKKKLFEFLETNNINDFIADKIWFMEHLNLINNNYTYWTDGGLSWFYNLKNDKFTDEEKFKFMICNLHFYYIFNDKLLSIQKIKELYDLTIIVQNFIKSTLNIDTDIITTNFEYNDGNFIFNNDENSILKQNILNIKLILKTTDIIKGGDNNNSSSSSYINFKPRRYSIKDLAILDNKIALEFTLECLDKTTDINKFNELYIIIPKKNNYKINQNPLIVRKKLNRLNILGLMTYNFIYINKIEDNSGLNIENLRLNIYINYFLNRPNKFLNFFQNILNNYKSVYKPLNQIVIQKISSFIYDYKYPFLSSHINTINRYYIAKIRPIINSFLLNINKEISAYNAVLMIKGGESLRRYDDNISFTKDIDTVLYYNNNDNYEKIKKIVINNLFKFRCYIEDNKLSIFNDKDIFNLNIDNIQFSIENINEGSQNLLIKNYMRNDKYGTFDFFTSSIEYFIYITDISDKDKPIILYKYYTMLNILDVSCKFTELNYHNYYQDINGLPIANIKYLINDIENIYIDNFNLIYRIIDEKVIKDITRYNFLVNFYNSNYIKPKDEYKDIKIIKDLDKSIMFFIYKYKKSIPFTTNDYLAINNLLKNPKIFEEISKYPILLKFFNDIINFNINLPNENLSITSNFYNNYNYHKSKNFIVRKYLYYYKTTSDINILVKNINNIINANKKTFKFID
jgi:hypothetical protein